MNETFDSSRSHAQKGRAFQLVARDALKQVFNRNFELEVRLAIGAEKLHSFDLATHDRTIIAECKAYSFTISGNIPSAKITALREAAMWLNAIPGDIGKLLIVKREVHPKTGETLGRYFARLNAHHLIDVVVLEMPESGGNLVCVHGSVAAVPLIA